VVSVVAEGARPLISLALGWMQLGTPLALIDVVNLFDPHEPPVIDPPPPLPVALPPLWTKPPPPIGPAHARGVMIRITISTAHAKPFQCRREYRHPPPAACNGIGDGVRELRIKPGIFG
jgi:hypothetical protein